MKADIAVVGGGLAGLAAALRAATCGAHVVLLERDGWLGGNATAANVHTLCGLYEDAQVGDAVHVHPGLPRAFAELLQRVGAARAPERAGRVWVLPTYPPRLHGVMTRLCEQTPSLELRLGCALRAAVRSGSGFELTLEAQGQQRVVEAQGVVDASGDAVCAALAGADVDETGADTRQLPSLIFRVAGVENAELDGFGRLRVTQAVAGAVREGGLPDACASVLVRPGEASDEVYITLNLPRFEDLDYTPLDPRNVVAYTERARGLAARVLDFLIASRPAFAKARRLPGPARIGVRETRCIRGLESLDRDDIVEGRSCADEVARSSWPIELWQDSKRATFEHTKGPASIPLGALISRTHPRLAAAGRCISATHDAMGALRVLGTALATGEAAGVAMALAVDRGLPPAEIPPAEIRAQIRAQPGPALRS